MTDKFPIASQWRTRGGHRAVIVDQDPMGLLVWHSRGSTVNRHFCGGFMTNIGDTLFDLIEEWKEPRKGEFWVNIYGSQSYSAHDTKAEAEKYAIPNLLACVKVAWTEGEGL